MNLDPLHVLVEMEAIRQLKARYFRYLDTKDWAAWTELWDPLIEHEMVAEKMSRKGPREEFVQFVSAALHGVVTVHHGHSPEIELTSPTTARAIWAFTDRLKPGPDAPATAPTMVGYGHYHETYVKSDAGWRIKTQKVTRLRVDFGGSG
jgi:hypothetical protein